MMSLMSFDPKKPYNGLPLLPPEFNFDDVDILKKVNKANIALSKLSGMALTIPNRELLIQPLSVREAVASSAIEDINTTVEEVFQAALFDESTITKEQKETLYYKDALLLGYNIIKEKGFLNTNGIIDIQKTLEPDKSGIRRVPGTKIQNRATGEILYTPPEGEDLLRNLLKNFEDFYNNLEGDIDPLIKMAILHYQFEAIHPFLDGNGRTGRILMVLHMVHAERLILPILFISGYINRNRSEYYRLLRRITGENSWKEWILYILTAVEEQARETTGTVSNIRELMISFREKIKNEMPGIYSADLVEFLFSLPFYSQNLITDALKITRKTAGKYLNELVKNGLLKVITIKKENIYYSEEFLNLLK